MLGQRECGQVLHSVLVSAVADMPVAASPRTVEKVGLSDSRYSIRLNPMLGHKV